MHRYGITFVNIRLFRFLPRQVLRSCRDGDPSPLLIPLPVFNQFYNKDPFSHVINILKNTLF